MKFDNKIIETQIKEFETEGNNLRIEFSKKAAKIQQLIVSLRQIQDKEETITIEADGKRTKETKYHPATDFDGTVIPDERKQKIFDYCMSEKEKLGGAKD